MYHLTRFWAILLLTAAVSEAATLQGKVTLSATGDPLHHATVLIPQLNRVTESNDDGVYKFLNLPAGRYDVVAQGAGMGDDRKPVAVTETGTATVDFSLKIASIKQEITVTASGRVETTLESMNAVTTLDTLDLAQRRGNSLGDVLDGEAGVHKRSSGPGTSRPVLRGFDGDRVLIMQDGVRTGTLSSQSGDHGEPVDPQSLERVEIVRGPATLLYGSNAIGGVVNMITDHHQGHKDAHEGLSGYLSAIGGSNNGLQGGSAGVSYGFGNWVLRMNTGGQRTSDYHTAEERVINSGARTLSGAASLARYSEKGWVNFGFNTQRGTYQVPSSDERTQIPFTRQNVRLTGGLQKLGGMLDGLNYSLNYSDWHHDEVSGGTVANQFFNKQFDYRLVVDQKVRGPMSGSFGIWGLHRDYKAVGEEAITPPVRQNSFAAFAVESFQLERVKLQFGGRLEDTRYDPSGAKSRRFTGFSVSAGANVPLWKGGALVASYARSYRAPALEEIYAYGPHAGNLSFEIGDINLRREASNGYDLSLRHSSSKLKGEINGFFYKIDDYVYLAPTGRFNDGFIEARYSQANGRYMGIDGRLQVALHPALLGNIGFDVVDAQLTVNKTPLPRIPPVRGRLGLEGRWKSFSLAPELILTNRQKKVFPIETQTAGYATLGLRGGYTYTRQHALHVFSVNWFNANNALYRNHLSFLKDIAAEPGRGVTVSYTVRFF